MNNTNWEYNYPLLSPSEYSYSEEYLFYRTTSPELDPHTLPILEKCVREIVADKLKKDEEFPAFNIHIVRSNDIENHSTEAVREFMKLVRTAPKLNNYCFAVTRAAFAHIDLDWAGRAFYSCVVGTGPTSYYLQLLSPKLHSILDDRIPVNSRLTHNLDSTTVELKVGEAFVFNPLIPHLAAPAIPKDDSLLILFQGDCQCYDQHYDELIKTYPILPHRSL